MKAVVFGAGNIGRGFLGQLLFESGIHTTFIDINTSVVDKINLDKKYPIKIVTNDTNEEVIVENISAIDGRDKDAVIKCISECDSMFTSIGVNILQHIAENISNGIIERKGKGLDIIVCENMIHANQYLKELVEKYITIPDNIGFVEVTVGRVVPMISEEMQEGNILTLVTEPYSILPADKNTFKNEIPKIKNLVLETSFDYHIQSKLLMSNMGHAVTAYLGMKKNYTYIWEALTDKEIYSVVESAMKSVAEALSKEHNRSLDEVEAYMNDLLNRFQNKILGDTCERVGRDAKRKLGVNDRLLGAITLCNKYNIPTDSIKKGVMAALDYLE